MPTLILSWGTSSILEVKKTSWMRFFCCKATKPSRGDSLRITSKSPGVTGTHLIHLRRMKGHYIVWYIYKPFRALLLSRNVGQFSHKAVYLAMVVENFEIYVYITRKCIFNPKNLHFLLMSSVRTLPQVPIVTPAPSPPLHTHLNQVPPAAKREGERNCQILVSVKPSDLSKLSPTRDYFRHRLFWYLCIFKLQKPKLCTLFRRLSSSHCPIFTNIYSF